MSFRTELQTDAAELVVDVLGDLGETIVYRNKEASTVNVVGSPLDSAFGLAEVLDIEVEENQRVFLVPKQTGFPPTNGINYGDTLTFDSVNYQVESYAVDDVGALYAITCSRSRPHKMGTL